MALLAPFYNQDGIVIHNADNIHVLRSLDSGSINLIYCDILYNTGKTFDDYDDNLGTSAEAVEWYRPRIKEMHRVLANDGSIFIHCNWRLDSHMRILMEEVFGAKCFRNYIYRKHSEERAFYRNFDSQMDIILYFVKDPNNFVFNETLSDRPMTIPLFENGFITERSTPRIFNGTKIDLGSQNKHWMVTEKQFYKMVANDEVVMINGLPYRFTNTKPIGNLWHTDDMLDQYTRTDTAEAYDTPKPDAVLERIISTCSNTGDTVADFFLGGGTTAVITKKLGRKGIFCDISAKACSVTVRKLTNLK